MMRMAFKFDEPRITLLLLLVAGLACLLLSLAVMLPAEAKWFGQDKDQPTGIENYEPPAENAMQTQCEPIRQQIVDLNARTPKYARFLIVPQREYLTSKHRKCKTQLMNQEYQYLKHVDVKEPTLDPLPEPINP